MLQGSPVEHLLMEPYPFDPSSFNKLFPTIDADLSAAIYKDLQAAGLINATGFSNYPCDQPEEIMCAPDFTPVIFCHDAASHCECMQYHPHKARPGMNGEP